MARKWSNQSLPGALHYVTGNLLDRQRVFTHKLYFNAFIEPCTKLMKDWPCKLIAYVLMPDHLHMIVNPRDGKDYRVHRKVKRTVREVTSEGFSTVEIPC